MNIQDRALLVRLRIESWGTTRKDDDANRAVAEAKNSTPAATRVSKRLAPEGALKDVKARAEDAREFVRSRTQPWSDDGARLLDAAQLHPLQDELRRKYKPAWWQEVQKVISQLDYYRDQWGPANLGDLYNAKLYPTRDKMEKAFAWNLDVLPLNPDAKEVRMILGSDYVDELQRAAADRLVQDLRERIAAPVRLMVERLRQDDYKVRTTLVENLRDLCKLIPALNLTNDPSLEDLRHRIESDILVYDAEDLRRSPRLRSETARKAEDILNTMADFMPGAPAPVDVPDVLPTCRRQDAEDTDPGGTTSTSSHSGDKVELVPPANVVYHEPYIVPPPAPAPAPNWRSRLRVAQTCLL